MMSNPIGFSDFIAWMLGIGVISHWLLKRYAYPVGIAFAFTAISSLRVFQDSLNGMPFDPITRMYDGAAESALISLLLTVMIAQSMSISFWVKAFKIIALINALIICTDFAFKFHNQAWGLLLNASMSGCFNAAIFPFFDKKEKWQRALIALSVVFAGRSLPIAVLFSGIAAGLFLRKKLSWAFLLIPLSVGVGLLVKGHLLFESDGRTQIWKAGHHFFKDNVPHLYGAGLGSFYVVGPYLSQSFGSCFIWLHSDWMQIIFEMGVAGFILVSLMYGFALKHAMKTPKLFMALTAYAAFGCANMPLRYPIAGLYGAVLIRWALQRGGSGVTQTPDL